ncbi:hypothetical protein DFH06DRAFT_1135984 [Mycena polygramma]|nr:hypothetical protein DFH06DRAFT_1138378 [Mycena polygramma]KAJ7646392.1 hypothetical protein DFH06DRAFT_1135984 [Mycena polygramma]
MNTRCGHSSRHVPPAGSAPSTVTWYIQNSGLMSADSRYMAYLKQEFVRLGEADPAEPILFADSFLGVVEYFPKIEMLAKAFKVIRGVRQQTMPIFYTIEGHSKIFRVAAEVDRVWTDSGNPSASVYATVSFPQAYARARKLVY